jgi:hypothetical protein
MTMEMADDDESSQGTEVMCGSVDHNAASCCIFSVFDDMEKEAEDGRREVNEKGKWPVCM